MQLEGLLIFQSVQFAAVAAVLKLVIDAPAENERHDQGQPEDVADGEAEHGQSATPCKSLQPVREWSSL